MNSESHRLQHQHEQEAGQQLHGQEQQQQQALEFATPEEMLRHDAAHTPVPPNVERRLVRSLEREGHQPLPWWRRFFSF